MRRLRGGDGSGAELGNTLIRLECVSKHVRRLRDAYHNRISR